jgi:hypothetical protein
LQALPCIPLDVGLRLQHFCSSHEFLRCGVVVSPATLCCGLVEILAPPLHPRRD